MNRKHFRILSLAAAFAMSITIFAGCTKTQTTNTAQTTTAAPTTAFSYPLKTDVTLKYWMPMHTNWTAYAKNFGELEIAKELTKRTGVKIEYVHPTLNQEKDLFNIMIASGDLPDIIEYRWTDFPGGPATAIDNSIIIKLNDTWNKYSPNVKKYLEANPVYNKESKMDDGSYYFYPFVRDGKELQNTSGPIIRKDWLDELGLTVPETVDDWYAMLKTFKDKKGATAALTTIGNKDDLELNIIFDGAYGIKTTVTPNDTYVVNGKVMYGFMQPAYKELLTFYNKLYNEGLLDKNFASTDSKARDANILNNKSGATYGAGGGQLGTWLNSMKEKDPKFNLVAVKYPSLKKGTRVSVGRTSTGMDRDYQNAITTKCKNVEAAARFLDYGYSKEGNLLYNFGTDGVSYSIKNGIPTYSDNIFKNPDKLNVAQAIAKYSRGNMRGPFAQDPQYIIQYYDLQQQKDALKAWSDHDKAGSLMPLITLTSAESSESAKIMSDVTTYVLEMQTKFIMGTAPLSDFDKFVDQLKKMNIEKAISLKQAALDRFNKR